MVGERLKYVLADPTTSVSMATNSFHMVIMGKTLSQLVFSLVLHPIFILLVGNEDMHIISFG